MQINGSEPLLSIHTSDDESSNEGQSTEPFLASTPAPGSNLLGIMFFTLSTFFLTAMLACVHALTRGGLPVFQVLLARELIITCLASLRLATGNRPQQSHRWGLLGLKAVLGALAITCSLWAVRLLPLADNMVITCLTPLWIALLAPVLLKEAPSRASLVVVCACAVGVLLVARKKERVSSFDSGRVLGTVLALLQSVLAALAKLVVRQIRGSETADMIVLSLSVVAALLASAGCVVQGGLRVPQLLQWVLLIGTGLAGYATQLSITVALQVTRQAAPAVAMTYLSVLWSLLIGYFVFGEFPSVQASVGALLICGSTLILALYEHFDVYFDKGLALDIIPE